MLLNKLSFSFSESEMTEAIKMLLSRMPAEAKNVPPELADLRVAFKNQQLEISTTKKMGFMPITISGLLGLRPTNDGAGIVISLNKISAGFISSQAIGAKITDEIANRLRGIPGCSVSDGGITLTKEALSSKFPGFGIPGKVNRFGIEGDTLYVDIG